MNTDTTGTLGQLTVIELLDTASHEVSGLTAKVETLTLPDDDRLIVEAYLGVDRRPDRRGLRQARRHRRNRAAVTGTRPNGPPTRPAHHKPEGTA